MQRLCYMTSCPKGKTAVRLEECKKCPYLTKIESPNGGHNYYCAGGEE